MKVKLLLHSSLISLGIFTFSMLIGSAIVYTQPLLIVVPIALGMGILFYNVEYKNYKK